MTPLQVDIVMVAGAASADISSTKYALRNCISCYEGNPFMQDDKMLILSKTAATVLVVTGCNKLRKNGHTRAAKVLRYMAVGVWLSVSANNFKQGIRK